MFFDVVLLRRQHIGGLGKAWLAATRGINFLTKKEMKEVNICKLCEDMIEFIICDSNSPRRRFSLRLSALLINGVLKIYSRQVDLVIEEVMVILSAPGPLTATENLNRRKSITGAADHFDTPPTPVIKTKRTTTKSKRRQDEQQREEPVVVADSNGGRGSTESQQLQRSITEMMMQEIAMPPDLPQLEASVVRERMDAITLKETDPTKMTTDEDGFGPIDEMRRGIDEFLTIDVEAPVQQPTPAEILLREPCFVATDNVLSSVSSEGAPQCITVVADIHQAERNTTREDYQPSKPMAALVTETELQPPPQSPPAASTATQLPVTVERPAQYPQLPVTMNRQPGTEVLGHVQEERAHLQPSTTTVECSEEYGYSGQRRIGRKKQPETKLQLQSSIFINPTPKKFKQIDRCKSDVLELADISKHSLPTCEFGLDEFDIADMMKTYMIIGTLTEEQQQQQPQQKQQQQTQQQPQQQQQQQQQEPQPQTTKQQQIVEEPHEQPMPPRQEFTLTSDQQQQEPSAAEVPMLLHDTHIINGGTGTLTMTMLQQESAATPVHSELLSAELTLATAGETEQRPTKVRRTGGNLPEIVPDVVLPMEIDQDLVTSLPPNLVLAPTNNEQLRHQKIIDKLLESEQNALTLEELCDPPYTKLRIARLFGDLLVLSRFRYVVLLSGKNSIELNVVKRGSKLTDFQFSSTNAVPI